MKTGVNDEYYWQATQRNLGLVTRGEQERLRNATVALCGLGGMGGINCLTLARMGIGKFHLADLDEFSIANVNRQFGATTSTAGRPKVDAIADMARDINPGAGITTFDTGIHPRNVHEFLRDVDVVVDAIDFFAVDSRLLLYRTARELGKTVVFSAPIGFSGTLHVFTPDGMRFEEYFDIRDNMSTYDKLVAFGVGLTPRATHRPYMDMRKLDASSGAGPSIASACVIGAGLLTTEVLVILLNRRSIQAAPRYVQFDPYRQIYRRGRLRWGNRGPLQRVKRQLLARQFRVQARLLER